MKSRSEGRVMEHADAAVSVRPFFKSESRLLKASFGAPGSMTRAAGLWSLRSRGGRRGGLWQQ